MKFVLIIELASDETVLQLSMMEEQLSSFETEFAARYFNLVWSTM